MKTSTTFLLLCMWAAHAYGSAIRTRSFDSSPASIRLEAARSPAGLRHLYVEAFNQLHTLRLQPASSPFASGFRLQTVSRNEHGRFTFEDITDDEDGDVNDLYEDPETGGVVRLTAAGVEGFISPSLALKIATDGQHEVMRQQYEAQPEHGNNDYLEVPQEARSHYQSSSTNRAKTTATVEMYIIVDSTLAAKLGSNSKVKKYLGVFWNAVNLRFATITDPQIKLVLAGALIIRKSSDETYINKNILIKNYIHGENTLTSLSDWAFQQKDSLPAHDMIYLMTGKDVADVKNGVIQKGTTGIAWSGAACIVATGNKRSFNTAMGEDTGNYTGMMTAAHEVAHNLGSPHDGSAGAATCSWSDGYIMSYVLDSSNKLFFSKCSKDLMKKYISESNAACLHTNSASIQIPLSSKLPGEILSMDRQCQLETGKDEAYAHKTEPENSLCVQLICQWQEQKEIYLYTKSTGRPAAEGTPCRTSGACKDGTCQ